MIEPCCTGRCPREFVRVGRDCIPGEDYLGPCSESLQLSNMSRSACVRWTELCGGPSAWHCVGLFVSSREFRFEGQVWLVSACSRDYRQECPNGWESSSDGCLPDVREYNGPCAGPLKTSWMNRAVLASCPRSLVCGEPVGPVLGAVPDFLFHVVALSLKRRRRCHGQGAGRPHKATMKNGTLLPAPKRVAPTMGLPMFKMPHVAWQIAEGAQVGKMCHLGLRGFWLPAGSLQRIPFLMSCVYFFRTPRAAGSF